MKLAEHIRLSLELPSFLVQRYLEDLSDADLMVRPLPQANHIAWQLGHLIVSEHNIVNMLVPGSMPPLPEGFEERNKGEWAASDTPSDFLSKQEYLKILEEQRAGTLSALAQLSDEQLMQPAPEPIQMLGKTVGAIFSFFGTHWVMHAGQWAVIRRKLGHKPLF